MKSRSEIYCLQAGRGVAACLVVLFHINGMVSSPQYWDKKILFDVFKFGHAGVEFFFVLSGFIMTLIHWKDIDKPEKVYSFAIKRVIRIYPIYWIVTISVLLLYVISGNDRSSLIYNSLLLIGSDSQSVLAVGWTLFHEIAFYLVFGILIFSKRIGIIVSCSWVALIVFGRFFGLDHYSLQLININFLFGIGSAIYFNRIRYARTMMLLSVFCFIMIGLEEVYLEVVEAEFRSIMYGLASAFGIAAAVSAEKAKSISSPYIMRLLGDSSYSLYLVHYPVIAIVAQIWLKSPVKSLPMPIAFVVLIAAALAAGLVTYFAVEKPIVLFVNKRMMKYRAEPGSRHQV